MRRRPQDLDYLYQLIDVALGAEDGFEGEQLDEDAPGGPDVDLGGVGSASEDEFWGAVASGADVGQIGLVRLEALG